jgi:DegV family protein with EDD domain
VAVRVKLIVDSTNDLPVEWLARWDVAVLTAFVNFGEESFLDDGIALPKAEFYRRLTTSRVLPSTAAPAPGMAKQRIRQQLEKAEHVVAFTVASQFSSIYNIVRLAAQEVDPERVTVYDSGTVSMGLGWIVAAAAQVAEQGGGVDDVLAAAKSARERTRLYAAIDTLEYLRRGGRVNTLVASLGTLLQIKPIIDVRDGAVTTAQRARTMSRARQVLIDLAHQQMPLERLAVLHTDFPDGAASLRQELADIAPAETLIVDVTTAIGAHIGPGAVGIATVKKS